jgi:hypothetical protein
LLFEGPVWNSPEFTAWPLSGVFELLSRSRNSSRDRKQQPKDSSDWLPFRENNALEGLGEKGMEG